MERIKHIVVIVLSAAILIVCAFLPRGAGMLQDAIAMDHVEQAQIPQISLTIGARTDFENLMLISQSQSLVAVTEQEANLSEEELSAALERELEPYLVSGLIDRDVLATDVYRTFTPYYSVPIDDSGVSGTLWEVYLGDELWSLSLYMDDQEGKILYIYYECTEYFYNGDYKYQDMAIDMLNAFGYIYFGNFSAADTLSVVEAENILPLKDGSVARRYEWSDEQYGMLNFELIFLPVGFYVYFP